MNRRITAIGVFAALLVLAGTLPANRATAQATSFKGELVGAWSLVSFQDYDAAGTAVPSMEGGNLKGRLILTGDGLFSAQIISEFPKLASKNRLKTTAAEDKTVAHGVLSFFGSYTVGEADKSISLLIERSSYPNQVTGKAAKRLVTFTGDDMRFDNPGRTAGGKVVVVWKRIK